MQESAINDAEAKLRFSILQEQLQIALCKIELESLHAVRHSLREDNSAIAQVINYLEHESSSTSDRSTNDRVADSKDDSALTELLLERLSSFEEMSTEISNLEAQAKQLNDMLSI